MDVDQPISREAMTFCWMLGVSDLSFSAYMTLPAQQQLAIAAGFGLAGQALIDASEQFVATVRARASQLKVQSDG